MTPKLTRPYERKSDWVCQRHNVHVEHKVRHRTDESTGKREYAGEYYWCPYYTECGYYVSLGDDRRGVTVSVTDEDGIALGRQYPRRGKHARNRGHPVR